MFPTLEVAVGLGLLCAAVPKMVPLASLMVMMAGKRAVEVRGPSFI